MLFLKNKGKIACEHARNTYKGRVVILCSCVRLEMEMNEKYIEQKFVEAVKNVGGLAPKFVSPGLNGVPDRIVLLPAGHIAFAELKAPGKLMRPLQLKRKRQIESLGFKVYLIDEISQIGGVIDAIQST